MSAPERVRIGNAELWLGDCREVLPLLDQVAAVVTDPPYGLSFMGKRWDSGVPDSALWALILERLSPGGHLLAFAGTRTQHRMAVAIEDAGFEIRDMIAWVYGCLDDATEVATEKGVMPYHKTKVGDRVLCYDVAHGEYTYQPILEIVEYDYSDTAYRLVGDFGEQVVSRNHRVIAECGGSESFNLAETLGAEARVPVLESLPALQQAVHDAQQVASRTKQDVQQGVRKRTDWACEYRGNPIGEPQGQNDQVLGLRGGSLEAERLASENPYADVQPGMQRGDSRHPMGNSRTQGSGELVGRVGGGAEGTHDGRDESVMEGRLDVPESERRVCGPADQVCALPRSAAGNGAGGRLCDGAPQRGGAGDWSAADAGGVCAPHQPRCDGQPAGKSDAVCHERTAQGIRAWGGHRSAVVRVVPFHYTGKVWCLRVPTGAFVAVRNGVAFPTGNSGFPKSLDVSKAIDKAAGADRAVIAQGAPVKRMIPGADQHATGSWIKDNGRQFIPTVTEPATAAALQWDGWGTALKPSIETITMAIKPCTDMQERDIILSILIRLEARLWLLSSASAAEKNSTSNQSEYGAACAIARWSAEEITNTRDALCDQMDTSLFELATNTSLSIVSSWRLTLAESLNDGSTSTIATKSSTTIDWRTLRFSLSQITPNTIIKACSLPGGFSANASTAESHFNASLLLLQSIRTLSVTGPAISLEAENCLGADVKPNIDPCIMARKPLVGTVAGNVQMHGTGAVNIKACRIPGGKPDTVRGAGGANGRYGPIAAQGKIIDDGLGRWPANLIHDGSDDVVALFPNSNGQSGSVRGTEPSKTGDANCYGDLGRIPFAARGDFGSASRFFYCAKATAAERGADNNHPTVKPLALMRYLLTLVTPPGGVVLDPFLGSGSTGVAAALLGVRFVGIEREREYFDIACRRIDEAQRQGLLI